MAETIISSPNDEKVLLKSNLNVATFSGGCFWCTQGAYRAKKGVISVVSGYSDGIKPNPKYEEVHDESLKFRESIQIIYDSTKTTFEELLSIFWQNIDPTDSGGQFFDRGYCYTTAIYYHNKEQRIIAEKTKLDLEKSKRFEKPIVTLILPFKNFYIAEDYHQNYDLKNPFRYKSYKKGSGRVDYFEKVWENKA